MRDDMFKVIVGRPRLGVHKAPRTKLRHECTGNNFIGMKRQAALQNAWTKNLNENLRPLERFLWKQRGRKWDDVYSEICASLDTGSTVKMHVREHLDDFVERHVCIDRDGHWLASRATWREPLTPEFWRADLYVDPHDGILKETEHLREQLGLEKMQYGYHAIKPIHGRVALKHNHELRYIDGNWFEVSLSEESYNTKLGSNFVEVPHKDYDARWWKTRYAHQWRAIISKRQLGKKELKKYGLKGGDRV